MKRKLLATLFAAVACMCTAGIAVAAPVPLTLTQLPGFATGSDATAVWVADLDASGLPLITDIIVRDVSMGHAGGIGAVSGSDIDAIHIATTLAGTSATLPAASVAIDFGAALFAPGTQRAPAAPDLFNVPGGVIDTVASTVDTYDGGIAPYARFFSMGDGGELTLKFAVPFDPSVDRYLYIGEVTGNGEVFEAYAVPEPAGLVLAGLAGLGALVMRRRSR